MKITLKIFYFLGKVLAKLPRPSQVEEILISQVLSILTVLIFEVDSSSIEDM